MLSSAGLSSGSLYQDFSRNSRTDADNSSLGRYRIAFKYVTAQGDKLAAHLNMPSAFVRPVEVASAERPTHLSTRVPRQSESPPFQVALRAAIRTSASSTNYVPPHHPASFVNSALSRADRLDGVSPSAIGAGYLGLLACAHTVSYIAGPSYGLPIVDSVDNLEEQMRAKAFNASAGMATSLPCNPEILWSGIAHPDTTDTPGSM